MKCPELDKFPSNCGVRGPDAEVTPTSRTIPLCLLDFLRRTLFPILKIRQLSFSAEYPVAVTNVFPITVRFSIAEN